ncbi:MAG: helix-turn-helix transcriptional regulator [Clostridiales bacterium]|nr:helix-turn-helix transcriptional regulator [Clostridiales bacterium]
MNGFGQRLRELRGERTQAEAAQAIGLKASAYSMYEGERREPGFDTLVMIADHYGVSTDYLLGRTECKSIEQDMQNACALLGISQATAEQLSFLKEHEPQALWIVDDFAGNLERVFSLASHANMLLQHKAWADYIESKDMDTLIDEFQQPDGVGIGRLLLEFSRVSRECEYEMRDILTDWVKSLILKYSTEKASAPVDLERLKHEIDLQRLIAEANKNFKVTFKRGSPPPLSETETQIVIRPDEEVPTVEEVMQILEDRINGETQSS